MSAKLTWVYCWKPEPGFQWRCFEGVSGMTVDAAGQIEAQQHFAQIWGDRAPVEWRYEAPKPPKRPGDKSVSGTDKALEADAIPFSRLAHRFHPDTSKRKRWSADEVMAAII